MKKYFIEVKSNQPCHWPKMQCPPLEKTDKYHPNYPPILTNTTLNNPLIFRSPPVL